MIFCFTWGAVSLGAVDDCVYFTAFYNLLPTVFVNIGNCIEENLMIRNFGSNDFHWSSGWSMGT
jgi:hypothetical protein